MRFVVCLTICVMILGLFSGCQTQKAAETTASATQAATEPLVSPTDPTEPVQTAGEYTFTAKSIRTDGYHDEIRYPTVRIIRSAEELNAYFEENKELYQLENGYDDNPGFAEYCKKYDDAYFAEQILLLVLTEAGSGSVSFRADRLLLTEDGKLAVYIEMQVPEVGTADMAQWHIVIEPEAGVTVSGEDQVLVYLDDTLAYDGHSHQLATQPEIVEGEAFVYCGNTCTTIRYQGAEYGFMYENSVTLTDLLRTLDYNPHKVCRCLPQMTVETEFGTYGVHLTEGYARCEQGQAALTREQVQTIRSILEYEQGQAEELSQEQIGYIARKYCAVDFDIMEMNYDAETKIWEVIFRPGDPNVLGGVQIVRLKSNGELVDCSILD